MSSSKIKAWKQNLYRKSLITDKGELTVLGRELLSALSINKSPRDVVGKTRKEADDDFEVWWKIYPATDALTLNNKVVGGSRGLRQKKEDCRKKFNEILLEGEHSAEDLNRALKREITAKRNQSSMENENKMRYMQNTATYLNQKTYENFIYPKEDIRESTSATSSGAIDI